MNLREIREAYEQNYLEIQAIIAEMGGEGNILFHRKERSPLYRRLRELQKAEHRLNQLEEALCGLD
jgi:hypothetical protein